ncbi:MAG: acyltransferase [Demequina sp.]|nr:acyltransferase [Demequina sp.]
MSSTTALDPVAPDAIPADIAKEAPEGSQRKEHRIAGADGLRAAAALGVVFSHLFQRLAFDQHGTVWADIQGVAMKGAYGVSVFFVLSGTLLSLPFWTAYFSGDKMPSLRHYAKRRAARIVPGFYVALTVSFLAVLAWYPTTQHPLTRYLAGLSFLSGWHWLTFFPVESNGPLWSISLEVMSYIFMPIAMLGMFLIGRRRGWTGAGYWVGVLIVVVLVNQWITTTFIPSDDQKGWEFGDVGGAKTWLPYFNPVGFFAHFAMGIAAAGFIAWWRHRSGARRWGFDLLGLAGILGLAWLVWVNRFPYEPEFMGNFQNQPYLWPWLAVCAAVALVGASHSRLLGADHGQPVCAVHRDRLVRDLRVALPDGGARGVAHQRGVHLRQRLRPWALRDDVADGAGAGLRVRLRELVLDGEAGAAVQVGAQLALAPGPAPRRV